VVAVVVLEMMPNHAISQQLFFYRPTHPSVPSLAHHGRLSFSHVLLLPFLYCVARVGASSRRVVIAVTIAASDQMSRSRNFRRRAGDCAAGFVRAVGILIRSAMKLPHARGLLCRALRRGVLLMALALAESRAYKRTLQIWRRRRSTSSRAPSSRAAGLSRPARARRRRRRRAGQRGPLDVDVHASGRRGANLIEARCRTAGVTVFI